MGICLSARIKAESPCHTGANSQYVSTNGNDLSRSSSKVSSGLGPPTPRSEGEILQSSNLKTFSFAGLKTATRNFRPDSVLGEGGFGSVFKGWIDEHSFIAAKPGTGMVIAVKRLNQESFQGHREWLVALGAAKGLAFLHGAETKVIYRDFKTSNILLDSVRLPLPNFCYKSLYLMLSQLYIDLTVATFALYEKAYIDYGVVTIFLLNKYQSYNAKLSDFGLAKDGPTGDKSHVSTRVMGTYGYAAPEYLATGHLTAKSDVYSFGVVLLEVLSGRRAVDKNRPSGEHNLVEWAKPYLANKRKVFRVIDNRLEGQYSLDVAHTAANLALRCLSTEPKFRPNMDEVVKELERLQDSTETGNARWNPNGGLRPRRRSAGEAIKANNAVAYPRPSSSPLYT
ncbi:hypothetical protein LguiA_012091 [Lonicera macranthoides]